MVTDLPSASVSASGCWSAVRLSCAVAAVLQPTSNAAMSNRATLIQCFIRLLNGNQPLTPALSPPAGRGRAAALPVIILEDCIKHLNCVPSPRSRGEGQGEGKRRDPHPNTSAVLRNTVRVSPSRRVTPILSRYSSTSIARLRPIPDRSLNSAAVK